MCHPSQRAFIHGWLLRREFGPRIRNWSTFNEPGVFAFSGYILGSFPPGRFLATQLAGLVVKHMLIAHDKAYHLIKSLPGASESQGFRRYMSAMVSWSARLLTLIMQPINGCRSPTGKGVPLLVQLSQLPRGILAMCRRSLVGGGAGAQRDALRGVPWRHPHEIRTAHSFPCLCALLSPPMLSCLCAWKTIMTEHTANEVHFCAMKFLEPIGCPMAAWDFPSDNARLDARRSQ